MATRANPVITDVALADGVVTVSGGGFQDARVSVDDTAVPSTLDPTTSTLTAPSRTEPPPPSPWW